MTKKNVYGHSWIRDTYFKCRRNCGEKFYYRTDSPRERGNAEKQRNEHEKSCNGIKPEIKEELEVSDD